MGDDFEPIPFLKIIDTVVTPALLLALPSDHVTEVRVYEGTLTRTIGSRAPRAVPCVRLSLKVAAEEFEDVVYDVESAEDLELTDLTDRLVSNLNDFVAESRFGWGQDRDVT